MAAWCVTSAPLVLGFDLTNTTLMDKIYPIVANPRAISINQAWAGHPGRLVSNASETFVAPTAHGAGSTCGARAKRPCENVTFPVTQIWTKPLPANATSGRAQQAVLVINLSPMEQEGLTIDLQHLGLGGWEGATAMEVWSGAELGRVNPIESFRLQAHESRFLVLTSA
eukprot:COSAG05_NODE_1876_length_3913_cov_86.680126_5_plen_169_part_00